MRHLFSKRQRGACLVALLSAVALAACLGTSTAMARYAMETSHAAEVNILARFGVVYDANGGAFSDGSARKSALATVGDTFGEAATENANGTAATVATADWYGEVGADGAIQGVAPIRRGYTFEGWCVSQLPDASAEATSVQGSTRTAHDVFSASGDLTLYACWKKSG